MPALVRAWHPGRSRCSKRPKRPAQVAITVPTRDAVGAWIGSIDRFPGRSVPGLADRSKNDHQTADQSPVRATFCFRDRGTDTRVVQN